MEFERKMKGIVNETCPADVETKLAKCSDFFSVSGCPLLKECPFLHCNPASINATMQIPETCPADVDTKLVKCSDFFSVSGCPLLKECPFLHCNPASIIATMQIPGSPPSLTPASGNQEYPPSPLAGSSLAKPCDSNIAPAEQDIGEAGKTTVKNYESACIFPVSATIEIEASLAEEIIGKDGVNFRALGHLTGIKKIYVKDHKSDGNLKILKLKGTFDEVKVASEMARELIKNVTLFSRSTPL